MFKNAFQQSGGNTVYAAWVVFFYTGYSLGFTAMLKAGDCCKLEQEFLAKQINRTLGQRLKMESWASVQVHADQPALAEILEEYKRT